MNPAGHQLRECLVCTAIRTEAKLNFSAHLDTPMFRSSIAGGHFRHGPPPTTSQIINVAQDVVATLKRAGVDACFIGSMACMLYGNVRQPNDIDVLCLSGGWEQETLKRRLVELNSRFYLVPSVKPTATYKVLWYRIIETNSRFKVDILLPGGDLALPDVPLSMIDRTNRQRLPCAPLSLLLLLKLQGWIHHGESAESRYRLKQPQDVRDIDGLFTIACQRRLRPRMEPYLPQSFVQRSELRVNKYVAFNPTSKKHWEALGFEVQPYRSTNAIPRRILVL